MHLEREDRLAEIVLREIGKPIAQAIAEVEFAADDHRCFVGNGPGQLIRIVG